MDMSRSTIGKSSAGALGLLLLGTATGAIRVPGFAGQGGQPGGRPQSPTPAVGPSAPPTTPAATGASSRGTIDGGAIRAQATLGQAKLVRGANGELLVHIGIDGATERDGRAHERRPIDLSLVVDVSGSMEAQNKLVLLKQACAGLIDRLRDDDRVSVVAFSNDARTVFPLQRLGRDRETTKGACPPASSSPRDRLRAAIAALRPEGGTNLGGGLLAGADELRKVDPRPGGARRVILLTDGLANQGITAPHDLCDLATRLGAEGFSTSTVGLGLEYNETLLSSMADAGGGLYHYADKAERLATIYQAEVETTRSLVARDARLTIVPAAGVKLDRVYAWKTTPGKDGSLEVWLGDVSAGRHAKVVARLDVPTGTELGSIGVASLSLRYEDARGERPQPVAAGPCALAVELVSDETVARASVASDVAPELEKVEVGACIEKAREEAFAGKDKEARDCVLRLAKRLGRDTIAVPRADGTTETVELQKLAEGLAERGRQWRAPQGAASPQAEAASKCAQSAGQYAK